MRAAVAPADPIPLLGPNDPAPVEVVNPYGRARIVLGCEHAGRRVPAGLGDLGLPAAAFDRHIAWDIGAEGVARGMAAALDAPLALQRYSRLVIDCNRPLNARDLIPEVSDTQPIPANAGLSPADRTARHDAIHAPYHAALRALLDGNPAGPAVVLVTVHSFTPMLQSTGQPRPWHLGILFNRDDRLARRAMAAVQRRRPDMPVAYNEPYHVNDTSDYAIPVHGEARGIEHVMFEIRNDLIEHPDGQAEWAAFLTACLHDALPTPATLPKDTRCPPHPT